MKHKISEGKLEIITKGNYMKKLHNLQISITTMPNSINQVKTPNASNNNSVKILSQQTTPKTFQENNFFSSRDINFNELKKEHQRTQSQLEGLLLRTQLLDSSRQRTATTYIKRPQNEVKPTKVYRIIKQMNQEDEIRKQEKLKKQKLMEELEKQRIEKEKLNQSKSPGIKISSLTSILSRKTSPLKHKLLKVSLNIIEKSREKINNDSEQISNQIIKKEKQTDTVFKISTIVTALMFQRLHSKITSPKLARLISKHYLSLINYRRIEQRLLELTANPSMKLVEHVLSDDDVLSNAIKVVQVREIQKRLNEGLSLRRKASRIIATKKLSKEIRAEDIFSEKVLKRVRFLQMCFRMKVFKVNKRQAAQRTTEKTRKSTKVRAFKRRLGDIIFMSENVPVFQLQQEKKDKELESEKQKEAETKPENLGVFGMLWKAQNKFKNYCRHQSLKIPQKTCDDWVKQIQTLYYPSFRYISVFYRNIVVWSVSYYDVTFDKSCIVLFFKGEGRHFYHFRLDIPLVTIPDFDVNKDCTTVWPTVKDYLLIYLRQKGQLALQQKQQYLIPHSHKTSFIQGLSVKSRRKLTELDIQSIVETQSIITYLQNTQIVKIRKKIGTTYDLLPQLQESISNDCIKQYIINLPMIRLLIIDMLVFEQQILEYKRKLLSDEKHLIFKYQKYVSQRYDILSQILLFRFLHNNIEFFNDQQIQKINNSKPKKIFIQSCFIDINEILIQSNDPLIGQICKNCQLSIHLCYNGNIEVDELLLDVDTLKSRKSQRQRIINLFKITDQLEWIFDIQNFTFSIEALLFEKDKQNTEAVFYQVNLIRRRNERIFQPFEISITHFEKLASAAKEILPNQIYEKFNINTILKDIIFERSNFNEVIHLVLSNLITLNFKTRQVSLKTQYQHMLSTTLNFIEQMDHHSLYNNIQAFLKYSIYPHEELDLKKLKETGKIQKNSDYHRIFDSQFNQIDQIEIKTDYTQKQLEVVQEYHYDQKQIFWSQGIQRYDSFLGHSNFFLVNGKEKFIIVMIFKGKIRMVYIEKRKRPIIIDSSDIIFYRQTCVFAIQKKYQKIQLFPKLFLRLTRQYSFLRLQKFRFYCQIRVLLPSYSQIKAYLLSESKELINYLNRLDFIFTFKTSNNNKCYAKVQVFYLGNPNAYQSIKYENVYCFDGENLFISLQIHEFDSKLKKYLLIFNKYDIEQGFDISNYFTPQLIYIWCQEFVLNLKFDRKFLYKTPFSVMQVMKTPRERNQVQWIRKKAQNCILNEYQKVHNYDYNHNKKFLSSRIKIFRVIAHYIEKFYVVKQNSQITLLNESMYLQFKNYKLLRVEFVIITIQAHTVLDLVQIIYYFPKSKRRLMTNINLIQLQEIDFSLGVLFQLLDVVEFETYNDLVQKIDEIEKGSLKYRRKSSLNTQVMTKLNIMRQSIDATQQNLKFQKGLVKRRQGFVIQTSQLNLKTKVINQAIEKNIEMCQRVFHVIELTRILNIGNRKTDKRFLVEIMFWRLIQQQVFQLAKRKHKRQLKSYVSLFDRLVELFDHQWNRKYRIIGKEFLEKKQTSENIRFNYKVQTECRDLYKDLILDQEVYMTQNLNFGKTPFVIQCNLSEISVMDYVCTKQFRSDNGSRGYIEYFLEKKGKTKGIDLFDPQKPIPYQLSSNYNIYFRYYSLVNYQFKDVRINLREMMNQLVTDGLYKSQSNYMNSKINLSDILEMCHYLTQKIKTQNYMNLSRLSLIQINQLPELQQHIIQECDDQLSKESKQRSGDGYVYTQIIRRKKNNAVYQFQLFQTTRKVIINMYEMRQDYFEQKEYTYTQVEQLVDNFPYLLKAKNYFQALKRFCLRYLELQKNCQ